MGKAYTLDGQYDEATKVLVRAIDLARKADDQPEVALISHQMGVVFAARGRYGAAINSMQDALKSLRASERQEQESGGGPERSCLGPGWSRSRERR